MSVPERDLDRDERATVAVEHLLAEPNVRRPRHHRVSVDHLRRPGDALVVHGEPGGAHVSTTLSVPDAVELLRDIADALEEGRKR